MPRQTVGGISVVSDGPIVAGPSTNSDRMSIGTDGTTDIHLVDFTGSTEWARRWQMLPMAQPKAPATVSRNGRTNPGVIVHTSDVDLAEHEFASA